MSTDNAFENDIPDVVRSYLGFVLGKASQLVNETVDAHLEQYNIQVRHFGILQLIAGSKPLQQAEIGRLLRIDRTTMVKVIDELQKLNLIERQRDPDDRRAYAIYLTDKGKKLLPEMIERVQQAEQSALSNLTKSEREKLQGLLNKVS